MSRPTYRSPTGQFRRETDPEFRARCGEDAWFARVMHRAVTAHYLSSNPWDILLNHTYP